MATYAERLQKVRDAIDAIMTTGQRVRYEDKDWTAADLGQLQALEARYERLAEREARGGGGARVRYGVPI